ncbi:MAG: RsmB/NOP family class I SAM-dependent RNA methyltransferase [Hyphomicrobium sp.]
MTAEKASHRGKSKPVPRKAAAPRLPSGFAAREATVRLLAAVLRDRRSLDEALAKDLAKNSMEPRDRALARLIAGTVLRRLGELEAVLTSFLQKPLPERQGQLWPILLSGAAQLLFLQTPPHAAVSIAVEQARRNRQARRFDGLVNALLRRVASEGVEVLQGRDALRLNIPKWLFARWIETYGEDQAGRIAEASLMEAPLDISVKADSAQWAERLGGSLLPTGSVRVAAGGRIEDLSGYADGAWWVQDAAAALSVKLLGAVAGKAVADLCAAPGGKTAQLAVAGAQVTAVDSSSARLARLRANLERLHLKADLVEADAATWAPGRTFDVVLLDAPCTATGTIRRHPDILRLRRPEDVATLAARQTRLLDNALRLVAPGGTLLYCTCSLEPEEGAQQIAQLLARAEDFMRVPVAGGGSAIAPDWITPEGDLRTLPCHLPQQDKQLSGVDGFYAARLRRRA